MSGGVRRIDNPCIESRRIYSFIEQTLPACSCALGTGQNFVPTITTDIPRGYLFRFENYWLQLEDFIQQVQLGWSSPYQCTDAAKNVTAKFKNLRHTLKQWKQSLSALKDNIAMLS